MKVKTVVLIQAAFVITAFTGVYLLLSASTLPLLGDVSTPKPRLLYTFGQGSLLQPQGITVDSAQGNVYITDTGNQRVLVFSNSGKLSKEIGKAGDEAFQFPYSVLVQNEKLYVSDTAAGKIYVLKSKDGSKLSELRPLPELELGFIPAGIAAGGRNEILVTDIAGHRIITFDSVSGAVKKITGAAGTGNGYLAYPNDLIYVNNEAVVSDSNNKRLQAFNIQKKKNRIVNDKALVLPRGIARDSLGRMWIADALAQKIKVFSEKGKHLLSLEKAGKNAPLLSYPNDLAFDAKGRLFIVEREAGRVQAWGY